MGIVTGMFMDAYLGLGLGGFNTPEKGKFTVYGDLETKFTTTSIADSGKAVASLGLKDPATLPRFVLIGKTVTFCQLKESYEKGNNVTLDLVSRPLAEAEDKALSIVKAGPKSVEDLVQVLTAIWASGRSAHEPKHNALVADGLFEFQSLDDVALATAKK